MPSDRAELNLDPLLLLLLLLLVLVLVLDQLIQNHEPIAIAAREKTLTVPHGHSKRAASKLGNGGYFLALPPLGSGGYGLALSCSYR